MADSDFEDRRARFLAAWRPTYPWTVMTLRDHVYARTSVRLTCPSCRHESAPDLIALAERYGADIPLDAVLHRLKCEGCGRRGRPEVTLGGYTRPDERD